MHDETASDGVPEDLPPAHARRIPPPDVPSVALRRALTGVLTYCRALSRAVDDHDFEAVEDLAAKAVNLWLCARRACRRLATQSDYPSPLMYVALATIDDTSEQLGALFRRAITALGLPRVAQVLGDLRAEMDEAGAEPILAPRVSTTPRRPQRDTQIKP